MVVRLAGLYDLGRRWGNPGGINPGHLDAMARAWTNQAQPAPKAQRLI